MAPASPLSPNDHFYRAVPYTQSISYQRALSRIYFDRKATSAKHHQSSSSVFGRVRRDRQEGVYTSLSVTSFVSARAWGLYEKLNVTTRSVGSIFLLNKGIYFRLNVFFFLCKISHKPPCVHERLVIFMSPSLKKKTKKTKKKNSNHEPPCLSRSRTLFLLFMQSG